MLDADLITRIEHFGSTAVPGLAAKPIIDLLVGVRSLAEAKQVAFAETCVAANEHSKPFLGQLSSEQLGNLRRGFGQLGRVGSLGILGFDVGA